MQEKNDIEYLHTQKELLSERGICVIIPTYNNAGTIVDVVTRSLTECNDVIVVNDGCTDDTSRLLESIQGITIVNLEKNQGKGNALKAGFTKAKELGFVYAITLDADGQHYPEDIPLLVEANITNPGCIIIGKRSLAGVDRSKGSSFANKFSNFWFAFQTWRCVDDTQSGFRLYPLNKISGLSILTSRYEAELELLVFSSWNGVRIVEQNIHVYYPPREERVSHFRPGLDFTRISILNTVLCVLSFVYGWPRVLLRRLFAFLRTAYSFLFFILTSILLILPVTLFNSLFIKDKSIRGKKMRRLLHKYSKFVMITHGIPGTKFDITGNAKQINSSPSLIICNHQSYFDLMALLCINENLIFLTNDWVWNNPFFGPAIRQAEYCNASSGIETILPKLHNVVTNGGSICVFPEGTRSRDSKINRFHKGAFAISEELKLDILPIVIYGAGNILPKNRMILRQGRIVLDIHERILQENFYQKGDTLLKRCKCIRQYYIVQYQKLCNKLDKDA